MFQVTDSATLQRALSFLQANYVLAYDTETTGLNFHTDKVIGFGVSNATDGFYVPIYDKTLTRIGISDTELNLILDTLKSNKLLMFNASFDYRMTKFSLKQDLLAALHCDVLLLKHTCDEDFPFGLKEIAAKVFGTDVLEEKTAMQASIKANNGTAKQYFMADTDLIAKYCVQDCLLTYRLFNHYSPLLKKDGLEAFFYNDEVMPLYKLVTIPMEEQGVKLDMPLLQSSLVEITQDLQKLEHDIQAQIEPLLAHFEQWFLDKEYKNSTPTGKTPVWLKKHGTKKAAWLADSNGEYMFNLLSKHHLKKLFFETLDEEPLSKTDLGNPQVDDEFIQLMGKKYPWCVLLTDYNKLIKIKGTYIERLIEEAHEGRFYPSFHQHRTVSGRYAGDLQQLPRPIEPGHASELVIKHNNRIRQFILPDDGCQLMSADYEQLEPSVFAHTSGDPALIKIFNENLDFYSVVAIATEGLAGVSAVKTDDNYLGKVDKTARAKAKAYALGIAYGMTDYKLQFEIGVTQEEAKLLIDQYLRNFPKLAQFMNRSKDQVRFTGKIRTETGRVRRMPQAAEIFKEHGESITDSLQLWKKYNSMPREYAIMKATRKMYINQLNNAINFQVQGLAASIVNRASISIVRQINAKGLESRFCGQIHDEVLLNVPIAEKEIVSKLVKDTMESVLKLSVPLRTEPQFGNNFKECK